MLISELEFSYPPELVATRPQRPSRVMLVKDETPMEITLIDLIDQIFRPGDVLVVNNTRVLPRRIFSMGGRGEDSIEILFLEESTDTGQWQVLFPARKYHPGDEILLPGGNTMKLISKGLPQWVELSRPLDKDYFDQYGELPLPPYIQKARGERHLQGDDWDWYQTVFAKNPGSFAAPTASLHFDSSHLQQMTKKGVEILELTLHVGLGTFLPVKVTNLKDHQMHSEWVEIAGPTWERIQLAKSEKRRVFALGTTATRALESAALGILNFDFFQKSYMGYTDLLIQPPYEFKMVDILMTNFHQPSSTLLALVSAFGGIENVKRCYGWAIENKFKLFSYGDLTVWMHSLGKNR